MERNSISIRTTIGELLVATDGDIDRVFETVVLMKEQSAEYELEECSIHRTYSTIEKAMFGHMEICKQLSEKYGN